jgi:hypothetical protein
VAREGNSVSIRVLGQHPRWSAGLAAEIAVERPCVSGRFGLTLSPRDLEAWNSALDRLDAGEDIAWMVRSRGPSVVVRLTGEDGQGGRNRQARQCLTIEPGIERWAGDPTRQPKGRATMALVSTTAMRPDRSGS